MPRDPDALAGLDEPTSEVDLHAVGAALKRRRRAYLLPTVLVFLAIAAYVNVATPRYTAQTQILLENQETFFTRPDRINLPTEMATQLDEAAVASQVQLIDSPEVARRAIRELNLAGNDEFDPTAGFSPITRILTLVGLIPDRSRDTADARTTDNFLQRLTVYSPPKTRVVTIEFTSRDPALAARAANAVARIYIEEQSAAKRNMARAAAEALSAQIADLKNKLAKADAERERYRSSSGLLLAGNNNLTISGQQLSDINGDLSRARALQADAQAKATMIRDLLREGKAADVAEVTNNDIVRRIWEQRTTAQAQLALESRTLLPEHPRIKELMAQVAQYDSALKSAAKQAETTLENEASVAGQRVANLETVLSQQKKAVGVANTDQIHLAALDRVAQTLKEQLESSSTKYEEAVARQSSTATPADARVISRAVRPELPSYPKKLPFIVFGTLATFVFSIGYVVASEILSGNAMVATGRPVDRGGAAFVRLPVPNAPREPVGSGRSPASWQQQPPPDAQAPLASEKTRVSRRNAGDDLVFAPLSASFRSSLKDAASAPDRTKAAANTGKGAFSRFFAAFHRFGQSAAASAATERQPAPSVVAAPEAGIGWEATPRPLLAQSVPAEHAISEKISALADRIVAKHVPGRGLHIVGAGIDRECTASDRLVALSRRLAHKGRSIVLDLGTMPTKLASLADIENGRDKVVALQGLSELLAGTAGFAEVIHRDCASRLHFIPTGLLEADFRDFDLILDALSETYDFIVLLTPAYPESEIAKVMAPYADFVVLAASDDLDGKLLDQFERDMVEAGAREVLVVETGGRSPMRKLDVA